MADEQLSDYLDHLIDRAFTIPRFSGRAKSVSVTAESVRHYIEDEVTGRPVPTDDSADHFLLMRFHALREEYLNRPVPEPTGFYGTAWTAGGRVDCDSICGEIESK